MKYFDTLQDARNALALDAGFDPFLHGPVHGRDGKTYRRATKAALAALGYPVATSPDAATSGWNRASVVETTAYSARPVVMSLEEQLELEQVATAERENHQRLSDAFAAVCARYPEMRYVKVFIDGTDDWSFARFTPISDKLPVVDYNQGAITLPDVRGNVKFRV